MWRGEALWEMGRIEEAEGAFKRGFLLDGKCYPARDWLKKVEAANEVPNELVDEIALVGPKERIRERLQAWKQAGKDKHVGTMLLSMAKPEAYEVVAEELL